MLEASHGPVLLRRAADVGDAELRRLAELVHNPNDRDLGAHLDLARELGEVAPQPGWGRTLFLWEMLATLGAHGLQRARAVEPHLDAVAILNEAGVPASAGRAWGVFAAEGRGAGLRADRRGDDWTLSGIKPWCSLGTLLDRALVTAWTDDGGRGLFDVDLQAPGVTASGDTWHARGLRDLTSTGLCFDRVPARPVGAAGWYIGRAGFAFGGMGVAAVWFGGAVALYRRLVDHARRRRDQLASMQVGRADLAIAAARSALVHAATEVDGGAATGAAGVVLAARVRGVVADAVERVQTVAAHTLGPGPLVSDPDHAALTADLALYVRQHHAERDEAALGDLVLDAAPAS